MADDFGSRMIAALEAGRQSRRQQEQDALAADERKAHQAILKHQEARLKMEDLITNYKLKRDAAQGQVAAQQGQPQASFMQQVPQAPAGTLAPGVELPQNGGAPVNTGPRPVTFPGLPPEVAGGSPSYQQTPKSMEEIIQAQIAAKRQEALNTPRDLAPGHTFGFAGEAPLQTGPPATPPRPVTVNTVENGRNVTKFLPPDQASGQTFPSQPNAATAAAQVPEVKIEPNTPKWRTAQDLAYGRLTFQQFRGLYSYNRDPNLRNAIYDQARQLNPSFDPAQFEAGYKQFTNPQNRNRLISIDALMPIIDKIKDLSAKVPRGDVQMFNRLLLGAKIQISDKRVATLEQLSTLLGDEVGLALGVGTGSDLKTRLGLSTVNQNLGDAAFAETMDQLANTLQQRKQVILGTMGPYGGAAGGPAANGSISVTAPDGSVHSFETQAQADQFKQLAGIH